jgi:LytR cell envelope-related transcriptional attenuator
MAALVTSVLALVAIGGLLLLHRPKGARSAAGTRPVPKRDAATPLRPRSRISVLVLNGNGISGVAGTEATDILARGYAHAIPTDAASSDYARSLVLYRPGWQREAKRLARDARIATVAPLDGTVAPAYAHVPLVLILGAN